MIIPSRPALTLAEIDELEQMARAATPDNHPEHPDWPNMRERGDYCSFDPGKANFEFIEACDPQTVLALLAVARSHLHLVSALEFLAKTGVALIGRPFAVVSILALATECGWKPESEAE